MGYFGNKLTATVTYNAWGLIIIAVGCLIIGLIIGVGLEQTMGQNNSSTCFEQKDFNSIIDNQAIIANYVAQEAQCLKTIQKCRVIEDSNVGFMLGCLK